jgi:hypothetical membrane protein
MNTTQTHPILSRHNTMKNNLFIPVGFFLIVIIVAHFFAPAGYDWSEHSISELAAQGHEHAWIMRGGFIGFGVFLPLSLIALWRHRGRPAIGDVFIIFYGLSILLSGVFSTAPIDPTIVYSMNDAKLHSLFATIAGISMSIAITWRIFSSRSRSEKVVHLAFMIIITSLSLAFGLAESGTLLIGKGIIQRVLYLTGFAWLVIVGYAQPSSRVASKAA